MRFDSRPKSIFDVAWRQRIDFAYEKRLSKDELDFFFSFASFCTFCMWRSDKHLKAKTLIYLSVSTLPFVVALPFGANKNNPIFGQFKATFSMFSRRHSVFITHTQFSCANKLAGKTESIRFDSHFFSLHEVNRWIKYVQKKGADIALTEIRMIFNAYICLVEASGVLFLFFVESFRFVCQCYSLFEPIKTTKDSSIQ